MGRIEIFNDGRSIDFMIGTDSYLYVGNHNRNGTLETLYKIKEEELDSALFFCGGEIWKRKSKTPLFERVVFQFSKILKNGMVSIKKNNTDKIITCLLDIAIKLSDAEEEYLKYLDIEKNTIEKITKQGKIDFQPNAILYNDPTIDLINIAESVFVKIIIAYRKFPEILTLITNEEFKTGKKFINKIKKLLPPKDPYKETLDNDKIWIKELYEIRGEFEHESPPVLPFKINFRKKEIRSCGIKLPSRGDEYILLSRYLKVCIDNMLGFIEDTIAISLQDKIIHDNIRLIRLPEKAWVKNNHCRYVIDLKK